MMLALPLLPGQQHVNGLLPRGDRIDINMLNFSINDKCMELIAGSMSRLLGGSVYCKKASQCYVCPIETVVACNCASD